MFSKAAGQVADVVFANLRNTVVCASLAVAGLAVTKYPALSFFGAEAAFPVGFTLVTIASLLALWNMGLGVSQVWNLLPSKSNLVRTCMVIGSFIYFTASVTVFGGIAKLQSNAIRSAPQSVPAAGVAR